MGGGWWVVGGGGGWFVVNCGWLVMRGGWVRDSGAEGLGQCGTGRLGHLGHGPS